MGSKVTGSGLANTSIYETLVSNGMQIPAPSGRAKIYYNSWLHWVSKLQRDYSYLLTLHSHPSNLSCPRTALSTNCSHLIWPFASRFAINSTCPIPASFPFNIGRTLAEIDNLWIMNISSVLLLTWPSCDLNLHLFGFSNWNQPCHSLDVSFIYDFWIDIGD